MGNIFGRLLKLLSPEDVEAQYHPLPDPMEMLKTANAEKKYQGRNVVWDLIIQTMHTDINPDVIIVLTHFERSPACIWLALEEKTCPEILQHGSGSLVKVRGKVSRIQDNDIYLENCFLEF